MATRTKREYRLAVFGHWYEWRSKRWVMTTDQTASSGQKFSTPRVWRREFRKLSSYLPAGTRVLAQVIEIPARRQKGHKDAIGMLPPLRIDNAEFELL